MSINNENVIQNKSYNRNWLKYIDLSLLDVYPLQLANCDRLLLNDSVYVFDEVGSGKTISSGLMALDYLSNSKNKKVLVVTTNALFKNGSHSVYGQFLKDWFDKLPFKSLDFESRIEVTNNHYSHFNHKSEYGLVIIDEAQLFLNKESMRYKCLTQNISAEKVVFLTATPIKNSKYDLQVYVDIARKITGKKITNEWIDNISSVDKRTEDIICNTFDVNVPVTRYFKDTIMSLNIKGYEKTQARRLLPQLWQYGNGKTKNEVLLEKLISNYDSNNENKFVIFTRFVEKEAYEIARYLNLNGFVEHSNGINNTKTYDVVTGKNAYRLSDYSGVIDLPTVLILTYQIAEQGVNLPGYNHVVNYHISAFPSALEQRFGRIDRMGKNGSKFSEINMCFLIAHDSWDTNTWNFYCAISIYLRNLISYLPSKNTILSVEVLEQYSQTQNLLEEYVQKITSLINQDNQIRSIADYYRDFNDPEKDSENLECKCDSDLYAFIEENSIEFNIHIDENESIKAFKNDVKETLSEIKSNFGFENGLSIEQYKSIINSVSDRIFYNGGNGISFDNLKTLDAINECGKNISNSPLFLTYSKVFRENVKLPILISNYLTDISKYFEESFNQNDFNKIFPFNGYEDVFTELIGAKLNTVSNDDKNILIENCEIIVKILPFFKMCKEFKECLRSLAYKIDGGIRVRFDFNPFTSAVWQLGYKIKNDAGGMGLSKAFISLYWLDKMDYSTLFKLENLNGVIKASNWYKLSYHYTRKEAACFMNRTSLNFENDGNIFFAKEKMLKEISLNHRCFQNNSEFETTYANQLSTLIDLSNRLKNSEKDKHQSLFNHYLITDSGNFRTHSCYSFRSFHGECKVYPNDLWTQGIFNEIWGWTFKNCTWGILSNLPLAAANVPLFD